jgi:hypothetical protein
MKRTPKVAKKRKGARGRTGTPVADLLGREDLLKDAEAHASKHVSEMICRDRDKTKLRDLLTEGASSPRGKELNAGYFDVLRRGVTKRAGG